MFVCLGDPGRSHQKASNTFFEWFFLFAYLKLSNFLGLEPDVKKLVEDNCAKYAFFARHTALGTVSLVCFSIFYFSILFSLLIFSSFFFFFSFFFFWQIAPDDLAMDWIPTGFFSLFSLPSPYFLLVIVFSSRD